MLDRFKLLARLLRVHQWVKNTFILAPLVFSGELHDLQKVFLCAGAFWGFSLLASSVYMVNDFLDRNNDHWHPKKSSRPAAQAALPWPFLLALVTIAGVSGLSLLWQISPFSFWMGAGYILLNIIYNLWTKHLVLLDVLSIALGFQLRIWAGAFVAQVFPSEWLQMCVFLLALFLGFVKRRHELALLGEQAPRHRRVLKEYTPYFLDQIIMICAALTIVFYALYTISPEVIVRLNSYQMIYSIIFVIYGMFRYFYLVHVKKLGDDPGEIIFSDFPILLNLILWLLYVTTIVYAL